MNAILYFAIGLGGSIMIGSYLNKAFLPFVMNAKSTSERLGMAVLMMVLAFALAYSWSIKWQEILL